MTQTDKANAMFQDGPLNPKKDDRPQCGAWAPGKYLCTCRKCGSRFLGDKLASSCADCAYATDGPTWPEAQAFGPVEANGTSSEPVTFETGAIRHASGKGLPFCVPPSAMRALWKHFEDGADVHGLHNWRKGIPLSCYQNSISRHTLEAAEGGPDTLGHITAIMWNAVCWYWTEEQIAAGNLPATLDDLPYRNPPESHR